MLLDRTPGEGDAVMQLSTLVASAVTTPQRAPQPEPQPVRPGVHVCVWVASGTLRLQMANCSCGPALHSTLFCSTVLARVCPLTSRFAVCRSPFAACSPSAPRNTLPHLASDLSGYLRYDSKKRSFAPLRGSRVLLLQCYNALSPITRPLTKRRNEK